MAGALPRGAVLWPRRHRCARLPGLVLTAVAVFAAGSVIGARGEAFITAKDYKTLNDASKLSERSCADLDEDSMGSLDLRAAHQDLRNGAEGNEDVLVETLKEAGSKDVKLQDELIENLDFTMLVLGAFSVVLAVICILIWLFCTWQACPCCRACRCFQRERKAGPICRAFHAIGLLVVFVLVIIGSYLAIHGRAQAIDGLNRIECQFSTLMNTSLGGEDDPYFVGFLLVMQTCDTLKDQVKSGSDMRTTLDAIIRETRSVSEAVMLTTSTLDLLRLHLEDVQNKEPKGTTGDDLFHICSSNFCDRGLEFIDLSVAIVNDGLGSALSKTREEMSKQMSGSSLESLDEMIDTALGPLKEFKDMIVGRADEIITSGIMQDIKSRANDVILIAAGFFIGLAMLFLLFACMATSLWLVREKVRDLETARDLETNALEAGENLQYSRVPHRIACCVWTCSIFLIAPALLIGGILRVVSVPLSVMCVTLDDFDSEMMRDIAPFLGVSFEGDMGEMMSSLVDNCLVSENTPLNANVMDIIFLRNEADEKVYLRTKLLTTISTPVDAAFGAIDELTTGAGNVFPKLADSNSVVSFRKMLREQPFDAMLIPREKDIITQEDYKELFATLPDSTHTISRCSDFTLVGSTAAPGIESLIEQMSPWSTVTEDPNPTGCDDSISCLDGPNKEACEAGQKFVSLKRKVVDDAEYKCYYFEDSNGLKCDVKDMTSSFGSYTNDCIITQDGEKVTKMMSESCSLAELRDHLAKFDERLDKVFQRLDAQTESMFPKISSDLRTATDKYLLNPVKDMINGLNCGFMAIAWQGWINSLCYQGVYGFREIASAFRMIGLTILGLALLMNLLWRRTVDNVNSDIYGRYVASEKE
mmetsp:Transcript_8981/g.22632  ORF Transcript_8981/g.22632 Transcript_8981/m.22632 type:complete len:873 (+) Transcript_8981:76-2694(+)